MNYINVNRKKETQLAEPFCHFTNRVYILFNIYFGKETFAPLCM